MRVRKLPQRLVWILFIAHNQRRGSGEEQVQDQIVRFRDV